MFLFVLFGSFVKFFVFLGVLCWCISCVWHFLSGFPGGFWCLALLVLIRSVLCS